MDRKAITRRSALKKIGAAGIGSTLLSSVATASSQREKEPEVSETKARRIAEKTVEEIGLRDEFEDWSSSGVKFPQLFYSKVEKRESLASSIKYDPRAWVFPVEKSGEDVGYIAIDAAQTRSPVLAYGKSKAPQRKLQRSVKVAKTNGASVHERFLYHGGVEFGIETTGGRMVGLRGEYIRNIQPVQNTNLLKPTRKLDPETGEVTTMNPPNWSGSTDGSISGVPSWTETDGGNASRTTYGPGRDEWDEWDGCSPVAASMAIGYHEGMSVYDRRDREELIDWLHELMDTNDSGVTETWDAPTGIKNLNITNNSYKAWNNHWELKGNVKDAVGNNNPPMLNIVEGPFSKDKKVGNGHSVTVVGYRQENCGWFCSNFYHKVYNGWGLNEPADRVSHGNWAHAVITRIKPE